MNSTDKAMELVRILKEKAAGISADNKGWRWGDWICKEAADYIEAMQKDCRTCGNTYITRIGSIRCCLIDAPLAEKQICTNHDKWQAVEFKQLTRSEK